MCSMCLCGFIFISTVKQLFAVCVIYINKMLRAEVTAFNLIQVKIKVIFKLNYQPHYC